MTGVWIFDLWKRFNPLTEWELKIMRFLLCWSREEITSPHCSRPSQDRVKNQDKTETLNICGLETGLETHNTGIQKDIFHVQSIYNNGDLLHIT